MELLKESATFMTTLCIRKFTKVLLVKYSCARRNDECCKKMYTVAAKKQVLSIGSYMDLQRCSMFACFEEVFFIPGRYYSVCSMMKISRHMYAVIMFMV